LARRKRLTRSALKCQECDALRPFICLLWAASRGLARFRPHPSRSACSQGTLVRWPGRLCRTTPPLPPTRPIRLHSDTVKGTRTLRTSRRGGGERGEAPRRNDRSKEMRPYDILVGADDEPLPLYSPVPPPPGQWRIAAVRPWSARRCCRTWKEERSRRHTCLYTSQSEHPPSTSDSRFRNATRREMASAICLPTLPCSPRTQTTPESLSPPRKCAPSRLAVCLMALRARPITRQQASHGLAVEVGEGGDVAEKRLVLSLRGEGRRRWSGGRRKKGTRTEIITVRQ